MTTEQRVARFAREKIAGRLGPVAPADFPADLWAEMGREGLLGLGLPGAYGGGDQDTAGLVTAAAALVRDGRNLGIAVSWLGHNVVARFLLLGFGNPEQRSRYLPELAAGRVTAAVAISEPRAGAHPKFLATRAVKSGDRYLIEGEKAYLTNGPIAELFVVLAITSVEGDQKRFTAFLVPRKTPGLSLTQAGSVDFLRPSPHCGLRLESCAVPAENILGAEGTAFETMGKPLREYEDALGTGLLAGGMEAALELLVGLAARRGLPVTDGLRERLGTLRSLVKGVRALALECAGRVSGNFVPDDLSPLLLGVRAIAGLFQDGVRALRAEAGLEGDAALDGLCSDLSRFSSVGRNAHLAKLRKLGEWTAPQGE